MSHIIDLPHGEQVTKPGFYRTPMEWYHSQGICPGPSLSSSNLRRIINESPWAFYSQWEGNSDRYPDDGILSDGLILGKAAHCLILGDEVFEENFLTVPKDAPSKPTAAQIKARDDGRVSDSAQERFTFWDEYEARKAGRHELTETQVETIERMAANLNRSREAKMALTGDLREISIIWKDEASGIWLKARPDMLPDDGADFSDLKTFAPRFKSVRRSVETAIYDNGYHMQMALSSMGFGHLTGEMATQSTLVFAQTKVPHEVAAVSIDNDAMYWGSVSIRHAINRAAECLESGHWPMSVQGVLPYSLPEPVVERMSRDQADGNLPNPDLRSAA